MAQSVPPIRQTAFGGVFTAGNVWQRPDDTAVRCHNLRPMPGGALRVRGGWQCRIPTTSGVVIRQFHEFRKGTFSSGIHHIVQRDYSGTGDTWEELHASAGTMTLIALAGPSKQRPLAIATVRDKVFFDNGQGVRDGVQSVPPLSSWDGTTVRFVGLDIYSPSGLRPTISVTGGGLNNIQTYMKFFVGLYNSSTNHFSNGMPVDVPGFADDRLGPFSGVTIHIENLNRIFHASNNPTEAGELYYVFYATLDGFDTPYLILDATGADVLRVPVPPTGDMATSVSLSLNAIPKAGFFVSSVHEMPEENFPPKPMEDMCYQNARVYYILREGGSGNPSVFGSFSYINTEKDAACVGWSAAADDSAEKEFVGAPEESFPATNRKFVPSGERPVKIADLTNRGQVLVLTHTHSFWLEETADRLHTFQRISENRGIIDKRTFRKTPRGPMWVTQNLEIVLLHENSMQLEVLSDGYSQMLSEVNYSGAAFGVASDYLIDPQNHIERYQVWASDGWFAIHDFWLAEDQRGRSRTVAPGYSGKAFLVTAAGTLRDQQGRIWHCTGHEALWTQEGQPETRAVRTYDDDASGVAVEIIGDYVSQWLSFGDPLLRKEVTEIILTGDGYFSKQLNDRPVQVLWYSDLWNTIPFVTDNILALDKHDQSETDFSFIGKITHPHMRWLKYMCHIRGHSEDGPTQFYPYTLSCKGEMNAQSEVYGTLSGLALTVNSTGNNR